MNHAVSVWKEQSHQFNPDDKHESRKNRLIQSKTLTLAHEVVVVGLQVDLGDDLALL
mgnify:CR=1 FL=1